MKICFCSSQTTETLQKNCFLIIKIQNNILQQCQSQDFNITKFQIIITFIFQLTFVTED